MEPNIQGLITEVISLDLQMLQVTEKILAARDAIAARALKPKPGDWRLVQILDEVTAALVEARSTAAVVPVLNEAAGIQSRQREGGR